ncbi:MAG: MBL fold metallo-hydrolase [Kofleriaceae bacterium]|nr:MBL fold metallo-hydrolase [Kofleriaceae bacterium]MCB9570490.1 MBL fold metallo-hydrolase [Kofleriaceae bacterium]
MPGAPPPAGSWRVHLIDVGTGLSILIEGPDFTLLYDAGTNDPDERPLRVVAYLEAELGPSGDGLCVAKGEPAPTGRRTIDHVVLSHPHQDHASALDLVLHCFDVHDVWDAGRPYDRVFYREFVRAVAREAGATYHTAAPVPADRTVTIKGEAITIPADVTWRTFSEGDVVPLGADARFTLLHAEAKAHPDPNQNSVVISVVLGATRVLLTGDAESGKRADPDAPLGDVEAHLVARFPDEVDADILQVGHHGSKTSSRRAFLDAVSPSLALVSAGPRTYAGKRLPDPEVIEALEAVGATVLRTDAHDGACPATRRLGPPTGPGGCDSYVVTIAPGP